MGLLKPCEDISRRFKRPFILIITKLECCVERPRSFSSYNDLRHHVVNGEAQFVRGPMDAWKVGMFPAFDG